MAQNANRAVYQRTTEIKSMLLREANGTCDDASNRTGMANERDAFIFILQNRMERNFASLPDHLTVLAIRIRNIYFVPAPFVIHI